MTDPELSPEERGIVQKAIREERNSYLPASAYRPAGESLAALNQRIESEGQDVSLAVSAQPVNGRAMSRPPAARQGLRLALRRYTGIAVLTVACVTLAITLMPNLGNFNDGEREYKEFSTTTSQRASIQLPDGSTVQLAPQSSVRYDKDFRKDGHRTIILNGEAVFTVTGASKNPFIVNTAGTTTRVLGTTFGIRAYAKDSAVRVIVAEGRVSVNKDHVLDIGDIIDVRKDSSYVVKHDANVAAILGWTRGRLVYDGVSVKEMAIDLERWYGVHIKLESTSLAAQPVIAEFNNQKLDDVLQALAQILKVRYEQSGRTVTFHSL